MSTSIRKIDVPPRAKSDKRSDKRATATGERQRIPTAAKRRATWRPLSTTKRICFIALAGVFFALGAAGIVLPGLPTTPFLLLTSYFLVRAWPRMNARLLKSRIFGGILRDWQQRGGVRRDVKVKAIVLVAAIVCTGLFVADLTPLLRGIVASGAMVGLLVIRRLPEIPAG